MGTVAEVTKARSAREVLAWSRAQVDPALRAAVDTLPDSMRHIAGYHFGWWDQRGSPTDGANSGKALRPALVLLAAQAVGGAAAQALPAAVAVELVHNFSLLQDDVMDGDHTRRHRATAWSVFGSGPAILAGDALLTRALSVLAHSGHNAHSGQSVDRSGLRLLDTGVQRLLDGQHADLGFEHRADVRLAECVRMSEGKTGALLGCCCALGALFGGGSQDQVDRLRAFGEHLGLAFQFVDDLLGIWGDPEATGKPVYSDLRNRKKSLPVVAALTADNPAGHELSQLYQRDRLDDRDLVRAAELVDLAGGRSWSQEQIDDLLAQGLRQLDLARPTDRAGVELRALARLVARRDR